jgi:hypothetical protein
MGQNRVQAGSNNSTVTLQVIGGKEKEILKSETVTFAHEYQGLGPKKDSAGKGQQHIQMRDPSGQSASGRLVLVSGSLQCEGEEKMIPR